MLQDLQNAGTRFFLPGVHTELRAQWNRDRFVMMVNGDLQTNVRQDVSGVSARVYQNGVYGFSSVADCSPQAIARVAGAALDNASFLSRKAGTGRPTPPPLPKFAVQAPNLTKDLEQAYYMDRAKALNSYIDQKYPGLMARRIGMVSESTEKYLTTSDGGEGHLMIPRAYAFVSFTADSPTGAPVSQSRLMGGTGSLDLYLDDLTAAYSMIDELYESIQKKREGVYPEAGIKTVILDRELAGILAHEAVGHTVEADLVLGGSVAGPALGKQVASELVTMTDFASTAFGVPTPQPLTMDDEGTSAKDALLIDKGILVGYMNNRETAQRFEMEPKGNARAYLYSDEPLIRMRNTAIHPGTSSLEEMIASVDDGYYLTDTNNGQADTTGEFMFGVCGGYEIKHGKLGRAILDTTITGLAFEMLKTVDMVGNEMYWGCSGTCGKKQPMAVGMGGPALRCKVTMGGR